MITKQLIQEEIERVPVEHLPVLYRIVLALEEEEPRARIPADRNGWREFVAETYGCLANAPIERSREGGYEVREDLL